MSPRLALLSLWLLVLGACASDSPSLQTTDQPSADPEATVSAPEPSPTPAVDESRSAGNSDDSGDAVDTTDAPGPTATAAPATVATSTPQPSPSPDATGSPTAPPDPVAGCDAPMHGAPAVEQTAQADLDGDGVGDRVVAYAVDDAGRLSWRLRVETAAGESLDSPLDVRSGGEVGIEPLGGADVDGDGTTDELFTAVGSGASARIVAIHARVGCDLVQVTISGAAATFPVGGSIGNLGGLECVDTDENGVNNNIVAWVGVADFDGAEGDYLVDGVEYRLRGSELERVASRSLRANLRQADFVYGQLSCGTVNL